VFKQSDGLSLAGYEVSQEKVAAGEDLSEPGENHSEGLNGSVNTKG